VEARLTDAHEPDLSVGAPGQEALGGSNCAFGQLEVARVTSIATTLLRLPVSTCGRT
jgi:hypothetical protein